jgi:hypothetical protein
MILIYITMVNYTTVSLSMDSGSSQNIVILMEWGCI